MPPAPQKEQHGGDHSQKGMSTFPHLFLNNYTKEEPEAQKGFKLRGQSWVLATASDP